MPKRYAGTNWRQSIVTSLRKRNKNEYENIRDLILTRKLLYYLS